MKTIWIALAVLIAALFFFMMRPKSYVPPKYIDEAFIGLCPPGQMPASYTASGGDCVPYFFD
jgi:hypothetical protein